VKGVSFGTEAARYDATWPGYPPVFVDRLMADNPRDVLDVGCGTGLAARLFVERGCLAVREAHPKRGSVHDAMLRHTLGA